MSMPTTYFLFFFSSLVEKIQKFVCGTDACLLLFG